MTIQTASPPGAEGTLTFNHPLAEVVWMRAREYAATPGCGLAAAEVVALYSDAFGAAPRPGSAKTLLSEADGRVLAALLRDPRCDPIRIIGRFGSGA